MNIRLVYLNSKGILLGLTMVIVQMVLVKPVMAQQTFTLSSKTAFTKLSLPGYAIFEIEDHNPDWVTIKSPIDSNHDKWAAAQYIFKGLDGTFKPVLMGRQERDGESTYKIFINGVPVDSGHKNNTLPNGSKEFIAQNHTFPNVLLKNGDTIRVESNCVTNKTVKIDSITFSYAGGRWTNLKLTQVPTPPPIPVESLSITLEPNDASIKVGATAAFKTRAKGAGTLKYRWQKDGDTTALSTDSVFSITPILSDSGSRFICIVSNETQKDTTRKALLSVSTNGCSAVFKVDGDTIKVVEGKTVTLTSQVACTNLFQWMIVSGPAPRIKDPEVNQLVFNAPRVTEETLIEYKFVATFPDSVRSKNIVVKIYDSIPDPKLTLADTIKWNGQSPLVLKPTLTNASTLKASPYKPELFYFWQITELFSDSTQAGDSITFSNPLQSGFYSLTACVTNGGPNSCKESIIELDLPVGIFKAAQAAQPIVKRAANRLYRINSTSTQVWDFQGRRISAEKYQKAPESKSN